MRCIDHQKAEIVILLSTQRLALGERVWNAIYEEEKRINLCKIDTKCLDDVITNIKDKIDKIDNVIDTEISISQKYRDNLIRLIKSCANRSIGNVQYVLNNLPTCPYSYRYEYLN